MKLAKVLALSAVIGAATVSVPAQAWWGPGWGGPGWGGPGYGGPGYGGWNDWGPFDGLGWGDGSMDMNFGVRGRGTGSGYGRGYGSGYGGYPYGGGYGAPYGGGYGAPYGGGYGAPYGGGYGGYPYPPAPYGAPPAPPRAEKE